MEEYVEELSGNVRSGIVVENSSLIRKKKLSAKVSPSWKLILAELFLPRGYPHSVSDDYMEYQIWDTVQAFASSMTAAFATEAVLRGAGVGDKNASALAAAVAWIVKDGLGMVSRIWFTWFSSSKLDAECKKWRLVADGLNDIAFSLDLIAPMMPHLFTPIVCMSSIARSIVGVAGGATRTVVTQHQARSENTADVAAKDGAQETLVNISALICSLILLPMVSGHQMIIWLLYFIFTYVHLYANYRAVTSLKFRTFNQSLLHIVVRAYIQNGEVSSIEQANRLEPLLRGIANDRHYGRPLSEVLSAGEGQKLSMEPDFTVAYCEDLEGLKSGYIAISSSCNCQTQIKAAFYAEYALLTGRFPSPNEADKFLYGCKLLGWSITNHRLAFDQWTYTRKLV